MIVDKLENRLTNLKDTLKDIQALLRLKRNQILELHKRIPHEEFSNSILSHEQQPPFSHGHKPPLMDNNIWHHFPKVDLNKFDVFDPFGWVTQIEHLLQGEHLVEQVFVEPPQKIDPFFVYCW